MSDRCKNRYCRKVGSQFLLGGYCDECRRSGVPELIARAEEAEFKVERLKNELAYVKKYGEDL